MNSRSLSNKEESRPLQTDGSKTNTLEDVINDTPNTRDSQVCQDPDWIKLTTILNRVSGGELYLTLRKGAGVKRTQDGRFRICITDVADTVYDHDLKTGRRVK
jgi:hypothetical protein